MVLFQSNVKLGASIIAGIILFFLSYFRRFEVTKSREISCVDYCRYSRSLITTLNWMKIDNGHKLVTAIIPGVWRQCLPTSQAKVPCRTFLERPPHPIEKVQDDSRGVPHVCCLSPFGISNLAISATSHRGGGSGRLVVRQRLAVPAH